MERLASSLATAGFREYPEERPGKRLFQREYDNGGILGIRLDTRSLFLSTHAHWDDVLAVYRALLEAEPELLIYDPQKERLHDADSFRAFSEESYRKLLEQFPDRAR